MGYIFRFVGGEQDGLAVPIPTDRAITFGRGRQNDVQVHDRKLSRTHCQVAVQGGKCVVTDLNSTNGTYVSGERIEERVVVPGDVVTIGTTKIKVAFREEAEDRAAEGTVLATCARCGKNITQEALDRGEAKGDGSALYCGACCEALGDRFEDAVQAEPRPITVGPGDRFGTYTLGDRLRETLYGPQFKASKKELGNPVMLTLLQTRNVDQAGKLLHACYQAGSLIHPNILLLYETGEVDGQFFFATEFVEGPTLQERLQESPTVPFAEAFGIVDQVAHAIAAAAEKHQSHGTLAPINIYVRDERNCKVGDFGLAGLPAFTDSGRPFARALMPYRAPEQLRGKIVSTFEADLFALGAIFYQMLSGAPPFEGEDSDEIRARILEGRFKPVREAVPDLPENMARILERCLAANPSGRYQTPREMLYDFEHAVRA